MSWQKFKSDRCGFCNEFIGEKRLNLAKHLIEKHGYTAFGNGALPPPKICYKCGSKALYHVGACYFCKDHYQQAVSMRKNAEMKYHEPKNSDFNTRMKSNIRADSAKKWHNHFERRSRPK